MLCRGGTGDREGPRSLGKWVWALEGAAAQGRWVSLEPRDPAFTGSDVHPAIL